MALAVVGASTLSTFRDLASGAREVSYAEWVTLVEMIQGILFHDRMMVIGQEPSLNELLTGLPQALRHIVEFEGVENPAVEQPGVRKRLRHFFEACTPGLQLGVSALMSRPDTGRTTHDEIMGIHVLYEVAFSEADTLTNSAESFLSALAKRYRSVRLDDQRRAAVLHALRGLVLRATAEECGATPILGGSRFHVAHSLVGLMGPYRSPPGEFLAALNLATRLITRRLCPPLDDHRFVPPLAGWVLVRDAATTDRLLPAVVELHQELASLRAVLGDAGRRIGDQQASLSDRAAERDRISVAIQSKFGEFARRHGLSGAGLGSLAARIANSLSLSSRGGGSLTLGGTVVREVVAAAKEAKDAAPLADADKAFERCDEYLRTDGALTEILQRWPLERAGQLTAAVAERTAARLVELGESLEYFLDGGS